MAKHTYNILNEIHDFILALAEYMENKLAALIMDSPHDIIKLVFREYPYLLDPYCSCSYSYAKRTTKGLKYSREDLFAKTIANISPEKRDEIREILDEISKRESRLFNRIKNAIKRTRRRICRNVWDAYASFRVRCFIKRKLHIPDGKLYDELPDDMQIHPAIKMRAVIEEEFRNDYNPDEDAYGYTFSGILRKYRDKRVQKH